MPKQISGVWEYFEKTFSSSNDAKCKMCNSLIKCKGSSTSGLITHLKTIHKIVIKNIKEDKTTEVPKKQIKLDEFIKRETLAELLSKCAAKDGMSLRMITKSDAIREFIQKRGFVMPKSQTTVKNLIISFYEIKKQELFDKISALKKCGERFSITVDEWSDININRYINVTLHNKVAYRLGLVKINGSCDAFTTEELVKQKLIEFGLDLKYIIASTHDGAAVMQKYGRIIPVESQLCHNHGIHLAVTDVLYKKSGDESEEEDAVESGEANDFDEDNDSESESYDNDETMNNSDIFNDIIDTTEHESSNRVFRRNIKSVLDNSRKLVKFFKLSSVRNAVLQNHVVEQENKKLMLKVDVKTRWNSLVPMLERLLQLKPCIENAVSDIGGTNDFYKEVDFKVLEDILKVLKPIELAVKELSKDSSTILTSEGVHQFLFKNLSEQTSNISKMMLDSLRKRYDERRNKDLVSLMRYLQNPNSNISQNVDGFKYSSKSAIIQCAKNIMKQNFTNESMNLSDEEIADAEEIAEAEETNNLTTQLQQSISKLVSFQPKNKNSDPFELIKKEFKLYESSGVKTLNLNKINTALKTIQPTSTSSERTFSVAGNFSTKLRSRMSFEILNALIFLKYYFLEN